MAGELTGFDPDWTVAPAASLADIMRERNLTAHLMAGAVDAWHHDHAAQLIEDVLARRPLGAEHATILAAALGTSVQFWLNYERIYRADLAAGRKDVTHAIPREVTDGR
jgi:plasmid maintenance system antidote protein VapI